MPTAPPSAAARSSGVGQSPSLQGARVARIFSISCAGSDTTTPIPRTPMQVATDYIRHAARAARKCAGDPLGGPPQPPDAEFYKTLANAPEETAAGLDTLSKRARATSAPPRRRPKRSQ